MTAGYLISLVLDEGKVRHLVLPKFDIEKNFIDYADSKIAKRVIKLQAYDTQDTPRRTDSQNRSVLFGPGLSPNRHLNAVVRHILPSLGQMLIGTDGLGYSEIKPDAKQFQLDPKQHEIFKEYDRHLTDLANHMHSRHQERQKNNREHGSISPETEADRLGTSIQFVKSKIANQRHDQAEHRGTGWDVSEFGEVLTGFLSPESDVSKGGLHRADRNLGDDHTIEQFKARLDHFYRNHSGLEGDDIKHPVVPERHYDRILSASKKISIPAGRFQGKRQAGMKRIMKPVQRSYDELRPTAKRKNQRVLRLLDLEKAKREKGNTP